MTVKLLEFNHHVPEVGLDHVGLLVGGSLLLLLPQLLDQGHWLPEVSVFETSILLGESFIQKFMRNVTS